MDSSNSAHASTLTLREIRELKRRIKVHDHPVRYVIYFEVTPGWQHFLNVSDDTFSVSDLKNATLFKQKQIAQLVAKAYSQRMQGDLFVAKVTTRNGTRKILRYREPFDHRVAAKKRKVRHA